jgi:hypothetical protein
MLFQSVAPVLAMKYFWYVVKRVEGCVVV